VKLKCPRQKDVSAMLGNGQPFESVLLLWHYGAAIWRIPVHCYGIKNRAKWGKWLSDRYQNLIDWSLGHAPPVQIFFIKIRSYLGEIFCSQEMITQTDRQTDRTTRTRTSAVHNQPPCCWSAADKDGISEVALERRDCGLVKLLVRSLAGKGQIVRKPCAMVGGTRKSCRRRGEGHSTRESESRLRGTAERARRATG